VLNPAQIPPVEPAELLARFVLYSRHFRISDNSVKPEAFMPHPSVMLSLTRHREASVEGIWREGDRVAAIRRATLYGRADVLVTAFLDEGLHVESKPIPENPNHAGASNWPADKPSQKIKALQIASKAKYVPRQN